MRYNSFKNSSSLEYIAFHYIIQINHYCFKSNKKYSLFYKVNFFCCVSFIYFSFFRFWAHHANIDRHFETWMHRYTTPMARSNYYYFPSTGFAPGCNLRDVISSNDPFIQLSRKENNIQPYTVKVSNFTV